MYKIKVYSLKKDSSFINSSSKYLLNTNKGFIDLYVSNENIEKKCLIEFAKCPFFIIIKKNITKKILSDEHFEISNDETTINLEITTGCSIAKTKNKKNK
ncbi:MAG: hypothetical protein ACNI25_03760 [Halarcobacter sp.]